MNGWPPLSDADRAGYRAKRVQEIFDSYQPLTPKEYIGVELCRRGFAEAASQTHRPPVPVPARSAIVEPSEIGPRRRGCIQRDEGGQLVLEMEPRVGFEPGCHGRMS